MVRLAILGATGDLAMRHLLPAIALLLDHGELSPSLSVAALGRESLATAEYRRRLSRRLDADDRLRPTARRALLDALRYHRVDLAAPASLAEALGGAPAVVYLALPPWVLEEVLSALAEAGLPPGSTLVFDKPFGLDGPSARRLEERLTSSFGETDVFRADHFLFHAMSRDITAFRSGDGPDGLGWNAEAVERIAVTWDEASALAGRAAYYDRTGALRDMVQSHLLQYLALLVSDGRSRSGASRSAEKAAVLDRLRPWSTPDLERAVFARYTAGRTRDGQVGAYLDEAGVDAGRSTETFVSLTLELDYRDWIGVPFRLRSGMALGTGERAVEIVLRGAAKSPW
nr:glucose-6-phosphate dehydrogenase [Chloroflexota bacterium]